MGRRECTLATVYELGRSRRSHVVRNMMLAAMVAIDSWETNVCCDKVVVSQRKQTQVKGSDQSDVGPSFMVCACLQRMFVRDGLHFPFSPTTTTVVTYQYTSGEPLALFHRK